MAERGVAGIAAMAYDPDWDPSAVLRAACLRLRQGGVTIAGLLQGFGARLPNGKREMWVEDIRTGERLRLDVPRGAFATACVLNPDALAQASRLLREAIGGNADLIFINRFGMEEASGRGLRAEIAEAVCAGHAVLIPVRRSLIPALTLFLGGKPNLVNPTVPGITAWAHATSNHPVTSTTSYQQ